MEAAVEETEVIVKEATTIEAANVELIEPHLENPWWLRSKRRRKSKLLAKQL